jgi:hypothetical protein
MEAMQFQLITEVLRVPRGENGGEKTLTSPLGKYCHRSTPFHILYLSVSVQV